MLAAFTFAAWAFGAFCTVGTVAVSYEFGVTISYAIARHIRKG